MMVHPNFCAYRRKALESKTKCAKPWKKRERALQISRTVCNKKLLHGRSKSKIRTYETRQINPSLLYRIFLTSDLKKKASGTTYGRIQLNKINILKPRYNPMKIMYKKRI